jgi:hypothetical protein
MHLLVRKATRMKKKTQIKEDHPLRKLFRRALEFGFRVSAPDRAEVEEYIEEHILCEFIHTDNLYRIRNRAGKRLEDIADMLEEGDMRLNAPSFSREFQVHKHIGDYTLFMLGMFPAALFGRQGREFLLGGLVIPGASLFEHYQLQGRRSYSLAAEFAQRELFQELSRNFHLYRNVLELVRMFLESARNREHVRAKKIITEAE